MFLFMTRMPSELLLPILHSLYVLIRPSHSKAIPLLIPRLRPQLSPEEQSQNALHFKTVRLTSCCALPCLCLTSIFCNSLKLRNHRCYFYGCDKSYSDASALIRHEKLTHGFFRRAHKPYARSSVQKVEPELDLELLAFMNAPTSLLSYPHSDVASFASTALPPTPSAFAQSLPGPPSFNWTDNIGRQMQSTDTFPHEMVPDLFLNPKAAANHVGSFPFPDLSSSTNSFAVPATNAGLSYTASLTSFPQYDIPVLSSAQFTIPGIPQPF